MGENHGGTHRALLNEGEEAEMEIFGYKTRGFRRALCVAGSILSCGGLLLLFHWKPEWDVWASGVPCGLEEANVVLLRTTDGFQNSTQKKVAWISLSPQLKPSHLAMYEEGSLLNRVILKPELQVRSLEVRKIRYAWDFSAKQFRKVGVLQDSLSCSEIHDGLGCGLTSSEQGLRREICGPNAISVEVRPIWKLLLKEVLHPFYIFQAFSVCLWLADNYIEYSVAIILMSLLSISLTVYDLRKQSVKLHQLVESHNSIPVKIWGKETGIQEVESRHLVPGDVLILDEGKSLLPCDAILLSGQCIVNESMLTGESIPVTKTSLPWDLRCAEDRKTHLLFCGTDIIQARGDGDGPARAVVLRTGFNTAKGELVRSILYPKPVNIRLYRDAIQFLLGLIVLAGLGMVYAVFVFAINGQEAGEVVKKALDVITIAVPPALPAVLTTGIIYTQKRLKKKGIFCISPQRINVCGQLNLICFDKTGTLTEDGLDLWGIVLAKAESFQEVHRFSSGRPMPWGPAFSAMASCHSLMVLDGKIQGDPLDLKMFESTHWELVDSLSGEGGPAHTRMVRPGANAAQAAVGGMAILRQFPFSSALQRMSVIAQEVHGDHHVFMKGAPEMVVSFCRPETVPPSFTSELQCYTSCGFRVVGLAHKRLQEGGEAASLARAEAESGLTFLGLLVLENRLKRETRPVVEELRGARIRSVMVTGDNIQTAVTVAREAGLIPQSSRAILVKAHAQPGQCSASVSWQTLEEASPSGGSKAQGAASDSGAEPPHAGRAYHFCLSGSSYEVISQHFSHLLPKLLLNATVFARMSPAQKAHLVQQLQKLDYYVGMCGDGANDCGALKEAHAGISLSEQEASVASPFTSKTPSIECVPELIRHGRAALVTSFCLFKYTALYSLTAYVGVLLLYWQLNSFGNYQFLFQDLAISTLVAMTMGLSGPHPKLVPERPPSQLLSPPLLLSVLLNVLLSLAVQVCGFLLVQQQLWYSPSDFHSACSLENGTPRGLPEPASSSLQETPSGQRSYENTTVWLLSTIHCLAVALVSSKGKPFREPLYRNYAFVVVLTVQLAACLCFLFADADGLYAQMQLVCTPLRWRVSLLGMLLVTFVVSFMVEKTLVENTALWKMLKRRFGYQSSSRYQQLRKALERDPAWPPLNRTDFSSAFAVQVDGLGASQGLGVTYRHPSLAEAPLPLA